MGKSYPTTFLTLKNSSTVMTYKNRVKINNDKPIE